jgi:hypothetical protein
MASARVLSLSNEPAITLTLVDENFLRPRLEKRMRGKYIVVQGDSITEDFSSPALPEAGNLDCINLLLDDENKAHSIMQYLEDSYCRRPKTADITSTSLFQSILEQIPRKYIPLEYEGKDFRFSLVDVLITGRGYMMVIIIMNHFIIEKSW